MDPISDLAEHLAQRIRRSVAVYDADLRLLGYSSHYGDADHLRLSSLASRRLEGPVRDVAFASRFRSWREPFRRPALHAHGHEHDRVSFPIRSRYEFLGFACIIDDDGLSEEEMQECLGVADEMGQLLESEADFNQQVETLLFNLLSDTTEARDSAARDLRDLGLFTNSTEITAMAMVVDDPTALHTTAIRRALKRFTSAHLGRSAASAVTENRAFLLIGDRGTTPRGEYARIAERVATEMTHLEPALAAKTRFGIGTSAELAQASVSYDHATVAAQIAKDKRHTVIFWESHPLEVLLQALVSEPIASFRIPPLVRNVVDSEPTETIATVAAFLDEAGSVARVSETLNLHRTTVYYRLRKFEKSTGLSLDDGKNRFLLQLWLAMRERVEMNGKLP